MHAELGDVGTDIGDGLGRRYSGCANMGSRGEKEETGPMGGKVTIQKI